MVPCESLEARLLLAAVLAEDLSAPTPQTTGPYIVGIYSSRQLDASASTDPDPGESLSFAWDLDNDNVFGETAAAAANGDEIGPMPTFLANSTPKGTYPITLRVMDSSGLSSDLTTAITIRDYLLNGTSENDSWRISMNASNIVDFYENAPPGAPPTFSIPFNKIIMIRIVAGEGDDIVSIDYHFPMNIQFGGGNDTLMLTGGSHWVDLPFPVENVVVGGTAIFRFNASQRYASLVLSGSGAVILSEAAAFLHVGTLSISDSAVLDLTDNGLIVDAGDLTVINTLIRSWQIRASIYGFDSLGAMVNQDPGRTFSGESKLIGGEILVKQHRFSDLNLDNQVTIADFIQVASHLGQSPATWADGDTNGDNAVTIADFLYIASWFGSTFAPPDTQQAPLSLAITSNPATKRRPRVKVAQHHIRKRIFEYLARAEKLGGKAMTIGPAVDKLGPCPSQGRIPHFC